jgi:hypothetical protein
VDAASFLIAMAVLAGDPNAAEPQPVQKRHALIVCGLTGDAEHHQLYAATVAKLADALTQQLAFAAEDVHVLFGDEPTGGDSDIIRSARRATRKEIERLAGELRARFDSADGLWVIVVGHSHYDGRMSWLNLPGPDLHQFDFAQLFEGLTLREQVFLLTTPTSGFYIAPLSAPGRVIITATQDDWETNETEYPHELARVLSQPLDEKMLDADEDGSLTVFDLYVTVARNLAQSYLERELLATEHPLLDDNGDGRGVEVQLDFLTPDQGGRPRPRNWTRPKPRPEADGFLSRSLVLPLKLPVARETPGD